MVLILAQHGRMASACTTTIESRLSTQESFNAWKGSTSGTLNAVGANETDLSTRTVADVASTVFATTACIQEKINGLSDVANNIHIAQQNILSLHDQIAEEEANLAVARDRVAYIRHPEQNTSFYESWFPLDRPMYKANVPYFVLVSVFLAIFTLFVLLSLVGVNVTMHLPSTGSISLYSRIMSYMNPFTISLFIILMSVVIYFMTRK